MKFPVIPALDTSQMPEEYYEELARVMGDEAADWARLPPGEREKEIRCYHENFWTPDDLSICPPELGGDEAFRRALAESDL